MKKFFRSFVVCVICLSIAMSSCITASAFSESVDKSVIEDNVNYLKSYLMSDGYLNDAGCYAINDDYTYNGEYGSCVIGYNPDDDTLRFTFKSVEEIGGDVCTSYVFMCLDTPYSTYAQAEMSGFLNSAYYESHTNFDVSFYNWGDNVGVIYDGCAGFTINQVERISSVLLNSALSTWNKTLYQKTSVTLHSIGFVTLCANDGGGHWWDDGEVIKTPTYKTPGYTEYTCTVCGETCGETVAMKKLAQAKITSITNSSTGITVKWNKVTGATAYQVYRKVGTGSWKLIKTTTSTSMTNTGLTNGSKYQYKVRAIAKVDGKIVNTGAYSAIKTMYRLTRPALASGTKNIATKKIVVKWNKNTKATGYQIKYVKGSTTKTVKVKGAASLSKTLSKLTKGSTYKVSVRSYKTVSGTTYYSAYSAVKSVKVAK